MELVVGKLTASVNWTNATIQNWSDTRPFTHILNAVVPLRHRGHHLLQLPIRSFQVQSRLT